MIYYPLQSHGIGDILYCQSLLQDWIKEGHKVVWGVEPQFLSIAKHFPDVTFVDKNSLDIDYSRRDDYEIDGARVIPLRWSDSICGVPYKDCMKSKYLMFGKDFKQWRNIKWERDLKKEDFLFSQLFRLKEGDRYRLVNKTFKYDNTGECEIHGLNKMLNIEMRPIEGFSLIDWQKIIENASEVHTVSTSLFYILDLLPLTCPIHLYVRKPEEKDFTFIDYLFTKDYVLHY